MLTTANTATANAMSVAVGMAQPASAPPPGPKIDQDEDERRGEHAAHGGSYRKRCAGRITQIARDELSFEFEPDDKEEDRQ